MAGTDYHVAVHMSLTGNILQALSVIASHMVGIRGHQVAIEQGFRNWQPAIMGVIGLFATGIIVKGMYGIASAADKVTDEMARMKMQGQSIVDIKKNWDTAFDVAIKTGRPVSETMAELTKLQYYLAGRPEEARDLLPTIQKMETIIHAVTGQKGEGQVTPLLKVLEEAGIVGNVDRDADLMKILEGLTKDITATRGTVSPAQIAQNILYMRAARWGILSKEALEEEHPFVTTVLPYLIQSYGGVGRGGAAGPGAALMSMFTKNVQGTLSKKSAHEAAFLGLLEGGSKFGHLKGADVYAKNPYRWVQEFLMPALTGRNITDQAGIIQEISKLYGTRMAADPAIAMALLGPKRFEQLGMGPGAAKWFSPMERHMRAQDQAKGIEEAMKEVWTMPTMLKERIGNAWGNLWIAIGKAMQPEFVNILTRVAEAMDGMARAAKAADPALITGFSTALLGLAAGLGTLSALALGAGVLALVGPGGVLVAIGAALVAMSPKVHQALKDLGEAMSTGDMDKIKAAGHALALAAVNALVDGLVSLMSYAVDRINQAVNDGLNKTMQKVFGITHPAIGLGPRGSELGPIPQSVAPWHWDRPYFRHHRPGEEGSSGATGISSVDNLLGILDSIMGRIYGVPKPQTVLPGFPGFTPSPNAPNIVAPPMPSPLPWDWKNNMPMPPGLGPSLTPSPQSFGLGPGGGRGLLHAQPWEPGGGQPGTAQVNNVIYLDGNAIARAVHEYSTNNMQHPTQAPYFNGREGFTTPDWQPVFA